MRIGWDHQTVAMKSVGNLVGKFDLLRIGWDAAAAGQLRAATAVGRFDPMRIACHEPQTNRFGPQAVGISIPQGIVCGNDRGELSMRLLQ